MKYTLLMISIFCITFAASPAQAKGNVKVGGTIPHDLSLNDQNGKTRNFAELSGKKGMVLVFVRSVNWCPFCQKQLIDLNNNTKKFSDLGYNVVSISYDTPQQMSKFVTKNKPKITLLSDARSDVIRAFGLLNEDVAKGTMSYGIPYPGTYIINNKKKVQAMFFKDGYKDRVSVSDLIAKIKKLNPVAKPVYVAPPMTMENMGQDEIMPEDAMIETPEKIMDPIIIPDDFDAAEEVLSEDTLKPIVDTVVKAPEIAPPKAALPETPAVLPTPQKVPEAALPAPVTPTAAPAAVPVM